MSATDPNDTVKEPSEAPRHALTRWVFLRCLGAIYLIVFISLAIQIEGLIGPEGISPVAWTLDWAAETHGSAKVWELPTLFWLGSGEAALNLVCGAGVVLSVLLIVGVAPIPTLALLWLLFLSVSQVGARFLLFQWDALLLEVGFVAIFLAPAQLMPGLSKATPTPRSMIWALRWILFRLMFSSGVVKLASGDPTWRDLSALDFHYETQPLPTWIGWYAHQLPEIIQQASVVAMFAIELVVPFFIFMPRRGRLVAFFALVGLQVALTLTGNFAFFGVLTLALCVTLLEDEDLKRLVPPHLKPLKLPEASGGTVWPRRIVASVAVGLIALGAVQQVGTLIGPRNLPKVAREGLSAISQWHLVNRYGVFAVMTTTRPEIIVEGSLDGVVWEAYGFRYKPGDVRRPPAFVAPHQPRLDWQMWFAALRGYRNTPWFGVFMQRLLEGEPSVVALLEHNPFPGTPPRFVRARLYEYHLSSFEERAARGVWWTREPKGLYCPVLSLPESAD